MEIIEKIKKEVEAFNLKKEALLAELRPQFTEIFNEIFKKYPSVDKFSWTQYTPYFNDGDECVFRVCNDYPDINGLDEYEIEESEDTTLQEAFEEIRDILYEIPEEFYRELFGNHVKVTVTRNGEIDTEHYEHD